MAKLFFLGLVVGNLFWSAHPIMGKILLATYTPAETAWLRYGSAWLAFLLLLAFRFFRSRPDGSRPPPTRKLERIDLVILGLVGLLNFCLAPWLQLTGLSASHASDNALIVAMEPLLTVVLAWIFLRDPVKRRDQLAIALALLGFVVLTGPSAVGQALGGSLRVFGNLALLFSMFGESAFSVGSAKLVSRDRAPVWIFGWTLTIGFAVLTLLLLATGRLDPASVVGRLGSREVFAMTWLGPVGTTLSYLFWIYALRSLSVASVALSLFIQPVFGTLLAAYFTGDLIGPWTLVGGALILAALATSALQPRAKS